MSIILDCYFKIPFNKVTNFFCAHLFWHKLHTLIRCQILVAEQECFVFQHSGTCCGDQVWILQCSPFDRHKLTRRIQISQIYAKLSLLFESRIGNCSIDLSFHASLIINIVVVKVLVVLFLDKDIFQLILDFAFPHW